MQPTIERLTRVLGATAVEDSEHYTRFVAEDETGARLEVSIAGREQRVMLVLKDRLGQVRATADLAPVDRSTEFREAPGRVELHAGCCSAIVAHDPNLALLVRVG